MKERILKCVMTSDDDYTSDIYSFITVDDDFLRKVKKAQKFIKANQHIKWVSIDANIAAYEMHSIVMEEEVVVEVDKIETKDTYFKLSPTFCNVYESDIDFEGIGKYNYCTYTAKNISMDAINLNKPFKPYQDA